MLAIGLKLLGIGKWIGGIFKTLAELYIKFWKITVPITLAIAAYFAVTIAYDRGHNAGYGEGELAERAVWEEVVAAEQEKNEQLTVELADAVADFAKKLAEAEAARIVEERIVYRDLETIVYADTELQQCEIDPEISEYLNDLKALGDTE
jgi:hypothetical protein